MGFCVDFKGFPNCSEMIIPWTYGQYMGPFIKSSYRVILTRDHIIKGSIKVICGTPLCAFDSTHVIYNASYYLYPTVIQTLLPAMLDFFQDTHLEFLLDFRGSLTVWQTKDLFFFKPKLEFHDS